jgi:hypothetical protein
MREGGCTCGGVRYRLKREPLFVLCCHGTCCQTQYGSAFVINALVESDQVQTLQGSPEPDMLPTESGAGQQVWRCPDCKVAVWSNYGGATDILRFVRVGTLDAPGEVSPDIHIYPRSKLPWVRLPDGVPAVEAYYDSAEMWPGESLERRKALFG